LAIGRDGCGENRSLLANLFHCLVQFSPGRNGFVVVFEVKEDDRRDRCGIPSIPRCAKKPTTFGFKLLVEPLSFLGLSRDFLGCGWHHYEIEGSLDRSNVRIRIIMRYGGVL
jgi:hypothetical protein